MKKLVQLSLVIVIAMLFIWFYNKPKNIRFDRINWELLNDTDTIRLIDYVIVYDEFAPFGIAEHLQ